MRPEADEHHPYYAKYIALVPESEAVAALESQLADMLPLLQGLKETQGEHRYAPDKWSVKQVLQHLIDGERVFAYRALRAARADSTPLPGFDENAYADVAKLERRTLRSLADEWVALRRANVAMFGALDDEALRRRTVANGNEISARALAFIIAGHGRHHVGMLRETYRV
jgi:uncharacterized damage-inducible protein DinB